MLNHVGFSFSQNMLRCRHTKMYFYFNQKRSLKTSSFTDHYYYKSFQVHFSSDMIESCDVWVVYSVVYQFDWLRPIRRTVTLTLTCDFSNGCRLATISRLCSQTALISLSDTHFHFHFSLSEPPTTSALLSRRVLSVKHPSADIREITYRPADIFQMYHRLIAYHCERSTKPISKPDTLTSDF